MRNGERQSFTFHEVHHLNIFRPFRTVGNNSNLNFSLRFELRLRFIPMNLQEMYQTQMDSFEFLYHQVFADYLMQVGVCTNFFIT